MPTLGAVPCSTVQPLSSQSHALVETSEEKGQISSDVNVWQKAQIADLIGVWDSNFP